MMKNKIWWGHRESAGGEKLFFKLDRESLTKKTFCKELKEAGQSEYWCKGLEVELVWVVKNSRRPLWLDQRDAE